VFVETAVSNSPFSRRRVFPEPSLAAEHMLRRP